MRCSRRSFGRFRAACGVTLIQWSGRHSPRSRLEVFSKGLDGPDVAVDEVGEVLVAGLGGDAVEGDAGQRCGSGVPRTQ